MDASIEPKNVIELVQQVAKALELISERGGHLMLTYERVGDISHARIDIAALPPHPIVPPAGMGGA